MLLSEFPFLAQMLGIGLCSARVFFSMWLHPLSRPLYLSLSLSPCATPSTVTQIWVLASLQVHQEQEHPAERPECFLALMRPQFAWSMSTVGLTAQEISFPIENPFLRGSHCHSMAESKPTWSYPRQLDK